MPLPARQRFHRAGHARQALRRFDGRPDGLSASAFPTGRQLLLIDGIDDLLTCVLDSLTLFATIASRPRRAIDSTFRHADIRTTPAFHGRFTADIAPLHADRAHRATSPGAAARQVPFSSTLIILSYTPRR